MGTTSRSRAAASKRRQPMGQGEDWAIPGAAERVPDEAALRQFVRLAGGDSAVIAVISCAATNPAGTGEAYAARFRQLGAREANWLRVWQRCDANSAEVVTALRRATGIFVADGDRDRLQRLLADTRATETILRRNDEGAVIAGISTGVSMLPVARPAGGGRRELGKVETARTFDLAELGLGGGFLPELGAEQYARHAVEWSSC